MSALDGIRRSELENQFGANAEVLSRIETERGFYLDSLEWSKEQPNAKEADRELKRLSRKAEKAHLAMGELVRELGTSTATARLALKRQSNPDVARIIRASFSLLGELQNPIYPHPRRVGGERYRWQRDSTLARLIDIYQRDLGLEVLKTMVDGEYESALFDFLLACVDDLPGFSTTCGGSVVLSSAIKRILEREDKK